MKSVAASLIGIVSEILESEGLFGGSNVIGQSLSPVAGTKN